MAPFFLSLLPLVLVSVYQDVLTDLKADAEILPIEPMNEDWLAHKVGHSISSLALAV